MPRGSKANYTEKQKRTAEHIEEGYRKRGAPRKKAERIAWATVNKEYGQAGTDKLKTTKPSQKGGRKGAASLTTAQRSAAAKKGWRTRRHENHARA